MSDPWSEDSEKVSRHTSGLETSNEATDIYPWEVEFESHVNDEVDEWESCDRRIEKGQGKDTQKLFGLIHEWQRIIFVGSVTWSWSTSATTSPTVVSDWAAGLLILLLLYRLLE